MITAAITAAVAAILAFFGVEPGPYLVAVAIGVKAILVALAVLFGVKLARRRRPKEAAAPSGGEGDGAAPAAPGGG